jgi:hypothetical protein
MRLGRGALVSLGRHKTYVATVLGALLLIGMAYWLSVEFTRLIGSILPGTAASPSRSMEPYELVFRFDASGFKLGGEDGDAAPAEWRLTLPRAFLWSEIGDNADVGGGTDHKFHSASLYATFDPKAGTFSPAILADDKIRSTDGFLIRIYNRKAGPKLANTSACIRYDELDSFYGRSQSRSRRCDLKSNDLRCEVSSQHKGWILDIGMPKKYYFGDYKKSCGDIDKLLSTSSTYIDDMRYPSN